MEALLKKIAVAENPRYNALIDTGALITGYSNHEVARKLLDFGLAWAEGRCSQTTLRFILQANIMYVMNTICCRCGVSRR